MFNYFIAMFSILTFGPNLGFEKGGYEIFLLFFFHL